MTLIVCGLVAATGQQARGPVDTPLLESSDWTTRARGLHQLLAEPTETKGSTKSALVRLLERENDVIREAYVHGDGASEKYGEEYGEYYSEVLGALARLVTERDDRALKALVNGTYNADSRFAKEIAIYGKPLVLPLLELTRSKLAVDRWNGYEVLGYVIDLNKRSMTKRRLSQSEVTRILGVIRTGLKDPDSSIRIAAIHALASAGDAESRQQLEALMHADPATRKGRGGIDRYPVREAAEKAISVILTRTP
jgi:hypothetical protein